MRFVSLLVATLLATFSFPAWAACVAPDGCPEAAATLTASAQPAAPAVVQIAQLPAEVVPVLAPGDTGTAPARVSATLSDGRPGGVVIRPEAARSGARASAGEQRSEPSSVWLMLFAGLAFAGFVVAKRSRS